MGVGSKEINIDEPDKANLFLGCLLSRQTRIIEGRTVIGNKWDMRHYLKQRCTDYMAVCEQATGKKVLLRKVRTPFMTEDTNKARVSTPLSTTDKGLARAAVETKRWRHWWWDRKAEPTSIFQSLRQQSTAGTRSRCRQCYWSAGTSPIN